MAAIASLMTARSAFRRFYNERWWDRKADAYTGIIEALYALGDHPGTLFSAMLEDMSIEPEHERKLLRRRDEAEEAISKAIAVGGFAVSERAIEILREFQRNYWDLRRGDHDEWDMQDIWELAKKAIDEVRREAREDLRVARGEMR